MEVKMDEVAKKTTLIRGGWIVAFDGEKHRIIHDGVVVYRGDTIIHVGKTYPKSVDHVINAKQSLIAPGFINAHVHVGAHTGDRMIFDGGRRDLFRSGFMNYCTTKGINGPTIHDYENVEDAIKYSLACLLKYGSTTIVEMGGELGGDASDGGLGPLASLAGELGIRIYMSPGMRSAHHYYDQDGRHQINWMHDNGLSTLENAISFTERFDGSYNDRVRSILVPLEYHLCSHQLLQRTKAAARDLGVGITLHLAESVLEFQDSIRHTGRTPVGMLYDLDFLGPEVIVGHGLYTSGHSQVAYTQGDDLQKLADTNTTVAHSPTVFARRGVYLESFQRYLDAGINIAIGTDSYPQDIVSELKAVSWMGKIADRDFEAAQTRDIYNAATLGGANALGRDDIGRISVGAKADIIIIDFSRSRVGPFIDPIKALIQSCDGEVIDKVIVDGQILVDKNQLLLWDEKKLLEKVRNSCDVAWMNFSKYWPDNVPINEAFPSAFETWTDP